MRLKSINTKTLLYHLFEFKNSNGQLKYALYDADMDMPVSYGSKNLVYGTVTKLPKNVTVVYYKPDVDKVTFYNPRQQKYTGQNEETKEQQR
jgi:ABC-type uncharacterized transport system substrate-binding protein